MPEYKIVNAMKTGEYKSEYGEANAAGEKVMFKYAVILEGETDPVEVSQKPSSAAPKQGDILNGTIESTQYGRRFKKDKGGYGKSGYNRDDATIKAMWAIGQAVGVFETIGKDDQPGQQAAYISAVENLAKELYAMVDRIKQTPASEVVEAAISTLSATADDQPPVESYEAPF